ncbi:hypothetical protein GQ457_03G010400 [Hibiscus cannabinus]
MASSGPVHKMEVDVEIKASPEQFHDMFANKPHHVHNTCYDKIQGCELHEGEWGKWAPLSTGVMCMMERPRRQRRVVEGDLMEEYKSFVITIQVSPKSEGSGSVVHWTLEYEKLHEEIDHPETLLDS